MMEYKEIDRSIKKVISEIAAYLNIPCYMFSCNDTQSESFIHVAGLLQLEDFLYTEHRFLFSIYAKKDDAEIIQVIEEKLKESKIEVFDTVTGMKKGIVVMPWWRVENAGWKDGYKISTFIINLKYKE